MIVSFCDRDKTKFVHLQKFYVYFFSYLCVLKITRINRDIFSFCCMANAPYVYPFGHLRWEFLVWTIKLRKIKCKLTKKRSTSCYKLNTNQKRTNKKTRNPATDALNLNITFYFSLSVICRFQLEIVLMS